MITSKQMDFLKSLLIAANHADAEHGLRQSGKNFCDVPRSAMAWPKLASYLTSRDASSIIKRLT